LTFSERKNASHNFSNFIQYKNRSNKRSILDYDNPRMELLSLEGQKSIQHWQKAAANI